jgi:hypothetical protein
MPSKEVVTFWLDMGAPISLLSSGHGGLSVEVRMPGQVRAIRAAARVIGTRLSGATPHDRCNDQDDHAERRSGELHPCQRRPFAGMVAQT